MTDTGGPDPAARPVRVWVKLCGMRSRGDVAAAAQAGADAVGFVVAPSSVRHVTVEEAAAFGAGFEGARFLVTVDLPAHRLLAAAEAARVTGVQPHGEHAAEAALGALGAGLEVLFPVRVSAGLGIDLSDVPDGAIPLLDTAVAGVHGGTGRSFDWSAAAGLGTPVVLAGGLSPDNVAAAVTLASPWGVDVSTGIERAPGVKDHQTMRRFVEALR